MPTTLVLFSPYFCFRSTENFIFFLSISKYLNYIYLIDLCCVGAEKAVQILIEMEDVWNFSPFLVQWGHIQEMNAAEDLFLQSHVF